METEIITRFKSFLDKMKYSQIDVARRIGATEQQVSAWLNFKEKLPERRILSILKAYSELNSNWLINENGDMLNAENLHNEAEIYFKKHYRKKQLSSEIAELNPCECENCQRLYKIIDYQNLLIGDHREIIKVLRDIQKPVDEPGE